MVVIGRNFKGVLSRDINDYPEGIVVLIDKPYRWTSADVIRKVKFAAIRHFCKKNLKVGHAGTLDPLATGVLILCIGNACKKAMEFQSTDKEYIAGVCFGATTPSYDLEKEIDRIFPTDGVSKDSIREALRKFIGEQDQVAPLFSAKQVDGVRAYELARKLYREGKTLDEAARGLLQVNHIRIDEAQLLGITSSEHSVPETPEGASGRINVAPIPSGMIVAGIRIKCSKGTYVRSFARDLGEKLGTGAFLSSLRRSRCGCFNADDAISVEEAVEILNIIQ